MKIVLLLLVCLTTTVIGFPSEVLVQQDSSDVLSRSVWDFFGLGDTFKIIAELGNDLVNRLNTVLFQIMFAGNEIIKEAKKVLSEMTFNLINHIGDGKTIVENAINQLNNLLKQKPGKRDAEMVGSRAGLTDTIIKVFGLDQVWGTITSLGTKVVTDLLAVLGQLLTASRQVFDAGMLIVNQLVEDLKNHAGDGLKYVTKAIADLKILLNSTKPGKRDVEMIGSRGVVDVIFTAFGELQKVWGIILSLGTSIVLQLTGVLTNIISKGKDAISAATPIVNQMVSDLFNHIGDAKTIVEGAIQQLKQIAIPGK